jgi:molecular chaperone DnaJ
VPPRPPLPPDDLYGRLEIAVDASPEVVEVAWRSLLRRHHPDVAGPGGLEQAKRINVAHDWLSDPALRARYDRERGLGVRDARDDRPAGGSGRAGMRMSTPRPIDPAEAMTRFLERVATLTPDEVDRLACADPAPIAFGATIARFLPLDRLAALEAMDAAVDALLDPAAARRPAVRDAVEGYGTELVLGPFLDELLSDPFRERTRERLTRGWEAAVGQPRFGPNGEAVRALLERLAGLTPAGVAALAGTAGRNDSNIRGDDPWPPGTSREDDEALRVSSLIARHDAEAAVPSDGIDRATLGRARRASARLAHILVLRHAFAPAAFAALTRPWRPRFLPDDQPEPRVRRPPRG